MKKFFPLLFILLCAFSFLNAQTPADKLDELGSKNPVEKNYLHLDREDYLSGQTIWFKAYLYSDYLPHDKSTSLYVDLLNVSSQSLLHTTFPVAIGVSQGQLVLSDTLSSGKYIIRAYTATQLNQDADFVFTKIISVTGREIENNSKPLPADKKISIRFFPEGGNFVVNRENTIAFKINDQHGYPVNGEGEIRNSKNETIATFSTYHNGMGMFDIIPIENETYYAVLKKDVIIEKYLLPKAETKGIVFRLMNGDDGIHFEIAQPKNDPVFQAAYMIGQMQHHVVFKQPLKEGVAALTGVIKTADLSSGILHITVFNKDGMPLAERISFIDNKKYLLPVQLVADTINFSARGRNRFTLSFKDTVAGNFSVAITDPAFNTDAIRTENIISNLLLTSDIKGYVHQPSWYFTAVGDSAMYAMDMLMMTNGWRRFNWQQLINNPVAELKYKDPGFITVNGRVTLEGTKKPFDNKEMLMMIITADTSRNMQMIKTDVNGYFRQDSIIFFGPSRILLSDIRGRTSRFVDIKPGADSLNKMYYLPPVVINKHLLHDKPGASGDEMAKRMNIAFNDFKKANGMVLSEVIVKSRKKSPLEELEEKYTSGAFSGDTRKTFDLINTNEAQAYLSIFDFLQAKVPGLVAGRNMDGDYYVYYRQMATISSLGNQGMDIFVDEVPSDASAVAFIPPSQIALVKVYSTFVGATGGGAGGVIAIYLKKGTDYFNSIPSAGEMFSYNGYMVIKEFSTPDYSRPSSTINPDHRITLHWKPDIYVNGINTKIPVVFYNNDRTKSFKVVVEGMTADGRMLWIEKIIGGKAF